MASAAQAVGAVRPGADTRRETIFSHGREGLLAFWGHTCGHLSNPIWYESTEVAEKKRAEMEARACWSCLNPISQQAGAREGGAE